MPSIFSAQVSDWVRDVEEVHTAVFRESAKRILEIANTTRGAGGNVPTVTGFLWASLMASTSMMPPLRERGSPDVQYSYDGGQVNLVIAGAELGETIFAGWTAVYASKVHYQNGYLWRDLAVQRWQEIVTQVEAELLQRAGLS